MRAIAVAMIILVAIYRARFGARRSMKKAPSERAKIEKD